MLLLLGLCLFLGGHSVSLWGAAWRQRQQACWGHTRWRLAYSAVSMLGLALIAVGYGQARAHSHDLWVTPTSLRVGCALLVLLAFVLFVATYMPGSRLKARVRHPMLLGVKLWALAHLLANARVVDGVLFGSFLLWAVLMFRAALRADHAAGNPPLPLYAGRDVITVFIGIFTWIIFALWLHGPLIGVRPLG